jgi:hypothetical protein
MKDSFRTDGVEDGVRVADVSDMKLSPGRDPLPLALRQVVEHVDLVAAREQRLDDV